MYDTFLFDWDGTLANTMPIWLDFYHRIFRAMGVELTDKEIGHKVFGDWKCLEKYGLEDHRQYFHDELRAEPFVHTLIHAPLHEHAKETLSELQLAGKKIAIVTSTKRQFLMEALDFQEITNLIDVTVCAEDVTTHKPNPEALLKALEALESKVNSAIMIGDSYRDVEAGHELEMDSALYFIPEIHGAFYDYDILLEYAPEFIIHDLGSILAL